MSEEMKKRLEKALPWSFLGVMVTLLMGLPAIYYAVREKTPSVVFEIVRDSNVLDVHKPMKDLSILFRGDDIRQTKVNLRILTINVENRGQVDIKQNDFDQNRPWGIRIENGQIVEDAKIIASNSDYIKENLAPKVASDPNLVEFSKIIFEKGKYFTLEIHVLHSIDKDPYLTPVGKIAGIEEQTVVSYVPPKADLPFWRQVFYGPALVQVIRGVVYVVATTILLIFVIVIILWMSDLIDYHKAELMRKKKEEYLSPLLLSKEEEVRDVIRYLFDSYIESGNNYLEWIQSLIKNPNLLTNTENINQPLNALESGELDIPYNFLPERIFKREEDIKFVGRSDAKRLIKEFIKFVSKNPVPEDLLPESRMYPELEVQTDEE